MATKDSDAKGFQRTQGPSATEERQGEQESRRPLPQVSALGGVPSLVERVQAQREQLFKAISIVECCKNASATQLDVEDLEYMGPTFDTIYDLLNTTAGELEGIASACRELGRSVARETMGQATELEDDED